MRTQPNAGHIRRHGGRSPVVYAITFDLDTKLLQDSYPAPSWQNASA